jgi:hypothetical protein
MSKKQIFLALIIGIQLSGVKLSAVESADDLLHKSEDALVKAQSFSVEYSAELRSGSEQVWLALQGKLSFKGDDHYFLTNVGNMFLVFPANNIWVSDGKNFLEIKLWRNQESELIQSGVADWDPGRPGPLSKQQCVKRIVRDGFTFLVAALVFDNMNKTKPMFKSRPGLLPYSASLEQPSSVTNAQILADDSISGKVIRHINYGIDRGTNGLEKVDLWLDAKSFLPIKRVTVPPHMSEGITENYSFVLNAKLNPSLFDAKRLIHEQKLEQQIAEAEKPDSRLLKAATGGDEALAIEALKAGANPNARTLLFEQPGPNLTSLMLASMSGNLKIVERLVKAGAEVNAAAPSGATPLEFAAMSRHSEVVAFLLSNGANSHLKDKSGYTALDMAKMNSPNENVLDVFHKFGLTETQTNKSPSSLK